MQFRNYMFDMESDERRRILWHAAILTRIPGSFSNRFMQSLVHASCRDRLLDPLTEAFTPKMASALIELRVDSELKAHIGDLRRKANDGTSRRRRMPNTRISLRPSI